MIYYEKGDPDTVGVYACRVDGDGLILEDKFLVWHRDRWWYPKSDQNFRGTVLGWVGPLQRKMIEDIEVEEPSTSRSIRG